MEEILRKLIEAAKDLLIDAKDRCDCWPDGTSYEDMTPETMYDDYRSLQLTTDMAGTYLKNIDRQREGGRGKIMHPELGYSYPFSHINEYCSANGLTMEEQGDFIVGIHCIIIKERDDSDPMMTFVLIGFTKEGAYRLIYQAGE